MALETTSRLLRVGTRASLLAQTQTGWVVNQLKAKWPGLQVELVLISSSGDKIQDRPLHEFGGKGLFTKELEIALLEKQVDLAVHSFKDVPVTMPLVDITGLTFAAVPRREDPRDVLAAKAACSLNDLPKGAKVGTGSLRRRCQLLAKRSDLIVEGIRGNIDTRLRKLREGQYDAVILAMAGVKRAGLFDAGTMSPISPDDMLPSAGQGALALQCRADDDWTCKIAAVMDDPTTRICVEAERAVVLSLEGDCHSPIAAYATLSDDTLTLEACVGQTDGAPPVRRAKTSGTPTQITQLAEQVAAQLR